MKIRVLGSAAGGGFPQWNCNHPNSRSARQLAANAKPRTQSSIAVSEDGERWFLFNASPDIRQHIFDNEILHPKEGLRHSPINGVVLTNADVDHIAGLLTLRESQAFNLYGTSRVQSVLAANTVFNVLNPKFVTRKSFELDKDFMLEYADGSESGISVTPFAIPGKVALWLEDPSKGKNFGSVDEDTIALEVKNATGETQFFYIPACAQMTPELRQRLTDAPVVLFDGTLWVDDEMIRENVGIKTGQRMGHMSVSGEEGTIAAFRDLNVKQKIFIHINTTNPILLDDSEERAACTEAGWTVSYDGMEIDV